MRKSKTYLTSSVSNIQRNSRGDTIVEVLLAILIVSLVLSAAFVSVSQSLGGARTSQERGEAVNITQGQLETVRLLATQGNTEIYDGTANLFCLGSSQNIVRFETNSLPSLHEDNFDAYPSQCRGLRGLYNISIDYDESTELFIATIRWDKTGSADRNEAVIRYRINPTATVATPPPPPVCEPRNSIALLLDRSGSMNQYISGTTTRKWQALKSASINFVQLTEFSDTSNRGTVISFHDTATVMRGMTSDKTAILNTLNTLGTNAINSTNYYAGFQAVDAEFNGTNSYTTPGRKPIVLFMTDGTDHGLTDPMPLVDEMKSKGTIIYAIGLFDDAEVAELALYEAKLSAIAGNGGYYVNSVNAEELNAAFSEIAEALTCI